MKKFINFTIFFGLSINIIASEPNWSNNAELPGAEKCFNSRGNTICLKDGNRKNIYNLPENMLQETLEIGSKHALDYPVSVTQLQLPKAAMDKFCNSDSRSPIRRFIFRLTTRASPFKNFEDLFNWIGLHKYPLTTSEYGPNLIANMGELHDV